MNELEVKEEHCGLQTSERSGGDQRAGMQRGDLFQTSEVRKPRWKTTLSDGCFRKNASYHCKPDCSPSPAL